MLCLSYAWQKPRSRIKLWLQNCRLSFTIWLTTQSALANNTDCSKPLGANNSNSIVLLTPVNRNTLLQALATIKRLHCMFYPITQWFVKHFPKNTRLPKYLIAAVPVHTSHQVSGQSSGRGQTGQISAAHPDVGGVETERFRDFAGGAACRTDDEWGWRLPLPRSSCVYRNLASLPQLLPCQAALTSDPLHEGNYLSGEISPSVSAAKPQLGPTVDSIISVLQQHIASPTLKHEATAFS